MRTQTYHFTRLEGEANIKNDTVPLQVNCSGAVSYDFFETRTFRNDFYYIYLLKGKMVLPEYSLLPGDVVLLEPGHLYHYKSDGPTEYLWVHYTGFEAYSVSQKAFGQLNVKQHIGIHKELIDCFQKMFREFMVNDDASRKILVCILREILLLTARYAHIEKNSQMPLLAIEHIHRHYKDDVDIPALARMENKSCTAFRLAFKNHTGISPNEYIIIQRISEACRLLTQTNYSVRDIAAEVGYDDPYYFSRIFCKKTGVPHLKYRKENS